MLDAVTTRLNSTDEMLCTAERNLGSSRIIQVLWRFPAEVSSLALGNEWDRLNHSRLSRQAVSARIPGARRKWVSAHNDEPLCEYTKTLTDDTVADWIDEQVRAPLPVDSTMLWRLATARYGCGSVVSLTVPHFRSDGLGIFAALNMQEHQPVPCGFSPASLTGTDLGDALRQTTLAIAGSVSWLARLLGSRQERTLLKSALRAAPAPAPSATKSEPKFFVSTIVDLDAASWEKTAQAHGGTTNSLFIEIAANLIRAAQVPRINRTSIQVGIPMNLRRSENDRRANALVVVPLDAPAGAPQHTDLRRTRQSTKIILQGSGEHSVTLVPEPLWHLLAPRYANCLKTPGAQQTDVVASNFGMAPDAVVHFANQKAESVALRTMNVPGLVPEKARLRASLCMVQVNKYVSVSVTGMPDHFGDAKSLRQLVADELTAWGLQAERWWLG